MGVLIFCILSQAWALLEQTTGNTEIARTLFKYGIKVDPKNEALWNAWIRLEEDEGNLFRANELRNISMQEKVEIALPKDFSMMTESHNFLQDFFAKVIQFKIQLKENICSSSRIGFLSDERKPVRFTLGSLD